MTNNTTSQTACFAAVLLLGTAMTLAGPDETPASAETTPEVVPPAVVDIIANDAPVMKVHKFRTVVEGEGGIRPRSIEMVLMDGELTVLIDGEVVPSDRLHQEAQGLIVLTKEGGRLNAPFDFTRETMMPFELHLAQVRMPRPTVMVGLHHEPAGAALEAHLHLDAGTTTLITAVDVGLPANQAGLEPLDIVVKIDGAGPAGPSDLHRAILQREPGQSLKLTVLHQGVERMIEIEVEAWDEQRFAAAQTMGEVTIDVAAPNRFLMAPGGLRFFGNEMRWETEFDLSGSMDDIGRRLREHHLSRGMNVSGGQQHLFQSDSGATSVELQADFVVSGPSMTQVPERMDAASMAERLVRLNARLERLERMLAQVLELQLRGAVTPPPEAPTP